MLTVAVKQVAEQRSRKLATANRDYRIGVGSTGQIWRHRSTDIEVPISVNITCAPALSQANDAVIDCLDRILFERLNCQPLSAHARWLMLDAYRHFFKAKSVADRARMPAQSKKRITAIADYLAKNLGHEDLSALLPSERKVFETARDLARQIGLEPTPAGRPVDTARDAFILELAEIYGFITGATASAPWVNESRKNEQSEYRSNFITFLDCVFDMMHDQYQPINGRTALYREANKALRG